MLVKYLGTQFDEKSKTWLPRSEFLENGLFRMTQPKFLNDKGSEARFYPYLNEFSPADLAYARKRFNSFNLGSQTQQPSDADLNFFLESTGEHYTLENTPTLLGFTDYNSIEAYNEAQSKNLKKAVMELHSLVLEMISSRIGVFSLSKDANNQKMWVHYADNNMGLAVTFKEEHSFFKNLDLQDVSYKPEDRASFTYYKNTIRINGEPLEHLQIDDHINLLNLHRLVSKNKDKFNELKRRLLYTKSEIWNEEQEKRIICPLEFCEEKKGKTITPNLNKNIPDHLFKEFPEYSEICLKKIPFDAFDSIIFGDSVPDLQKEVIIKKAQNNPYLNHLIFKQASFDMHGKITIKKI